MSDQEHKGAYGPGSGKRGPAVDRRGPYEFPALDEPPRFWAEKWAEFKRLLRLSWDESSARGTLALSAALIIVGCIMGVVDKLS